MTTTPSLMPLAETQPPSLSAARGARAVFVLIAGCSLVIGVAALGWWVWRLSTADSGYNSALTALYAFIHALIAGIGIWLTREIEPGARNPRGAMALAGIMMILTPVVYAELVMGALFPRVPVRETPYESDAVTEWRMKANYAGEYGPVPLTTNSDGFRSPEIPVEKPTNTARVICLGDSLTFGHGVEERFAYPQMLQRLLAERMPQRKWEVVNTGVEGYSTFQEAEQLRRCMKYKPDLVVLLFCMNDVTEKYIRVRAYGGTGLGYQGVADGAAGLIFKLFVAVRPYSSIARFLTPSRNEAERRQAYAVTRLWQEPEAPQILDAWKQAEKELDELVAYCHAHSMGLLLAVAPFATQLDENARADAPQRRLESFAAARGAAFVDLWPDMEAYAKKTGKRLADWYIDRSHFTEAGNQAIAEMVAERFTQPTRSGEAWMAAVRLAIGNAAGQTQ